MPTRRHQPRSRDRLRAVLRRRRQRVLRERPRLRRSEAPRTGLLCEGPGRIACPQNARLGLVGDGRQAGRVEAGEESPSLVGGEALDCEPMLGQRSLARRGPVLRLVEEPRDTTRDEERGAGLGLELPPELVRASPTPCTRRPVRARTGAAGSRRRRRLERVRVRTARRASRPSRCLPAGGRARRRRHRRRR